MLTQIEAAHAARRNLKGIAAMVAATALFTCGDAAMKLVSASLATGETVFLRGVCTVTIVTIAAFWTGAIYRLRDALVRAMGWRSVGDVGSALFFQAALARMPFADLMGILQMTPLSLTAASALFLGEQVGWRRWTAVAIGFAGALLVIKPGSSAFNAWALLGVLSVLCGTLRDVSTRRLDVALSPLLIMMLSQLVVASAGLVCWVFEAWKVPSLAELFALVFASVFSLLGHLCVIYSLRSGEVGRRRSLPLRRHRLGHPARLPDLEGVARYPVAWRHLNSRVGRALHLLPRAAITAARPSALARAGFGLPQSPQPVAIGTRFSIAGEAFACRYAM